VARALSDLLELLARVVAEDEVRSTSSRACIVEAERLARSLPWVHRTGKPADLRGKRDWRLIFRDRRLAATAVGTSFEEALGIERAVYFFVGACAYPQGIVALLWAPLAALVGTFTPYDTGALKRRLVPADSSKPWDADAKTKHLEAHLGHTADVTEFVGSYIAAHFRDPIAYVRALQKSEPDFRAYHGLVDQDGPVDRLSWTVEAQIHADVDISPDGLLLEEIWLDDLDLWDELPDDFKGMARVSPDNMALEVAVAGRIEERVARAQA
jgi:hypothetical protein